MGILPPLILHYNVVNLLYLTTIMVLAERPGWPELKTLFRFQINPPQPPQLIFLNSSEILMLRVRCVHF